MYISIISIISIIRCTFSNCENHFISLFLPLFNYNPNQNMNSITFPFKNIFIYKTPPKTQKYIICISM